MTTTPYNSRPYPVHSISYSESVKDARKIFRLFKSIIQYKKLITILLDDDDNLLKVFRVLGQVCFFFYWFFDNISIAYKIKLFKGNFSKLNRIASIFWLLSLLIMIPVCLIQSLQSKDSKIKQEFLLDSIKYTFDLLPATNDSQIKNRFFQLKINTLLVGIAGFFSGAISSYQNVRFVIDQKDQK